MNPGYGYPNLSPYNPSRPPGRPIFGVPYQPARCPSALPTCPNSQPSCPYSDNYNSGSDDVYDVDEPPYQPELHYVDGSDSVYSPEPSYNYNPAMDYNSYWPD